MAVKEKLSDDQLDYVKWAAELPEDTETPNVPWYKNYPSAVTKGLIEGMTQFGRLLSPLQPSPMVDASGKMTGELLGTPAQEEDVRLQRQGLYEKYLPTNKDFSTDTTQRAAEIFPFTASGGMGLGQAALSAGTSALAGQTGKALGAGELGQAGLELVGMAAPSLGRLAGETTGFLRPNISQKIPSRILPTEAAKNEKVLADFARRAGMSEDELLLTIKEGGFGQNWLASFSSKGVRTANAVDATRDALGRVWGTLRTRPQAQTPMTGQQANKFINRLSTDMQNLPREMTARIQNDYNDLLGSNMTGADIMNFWQDLNYYIRSGEARLGTLKEPITEALNAISPELGAEFRLTNKLHGNFAKLSEKLGTDLLDRAMSLGEQGMVVTGIVTGNFPMLEKVLGVTAARAMAREMIVNPRLKNLSARFMSGVNRNSPAIAKKVYDQMIMEVGKTNAEAAIQMSGLDVDKLFSDEE